MNAADLARRTAAALSPEFGADLPKQTEEGLRGASGGQTRQMEMLTHTAEIAVIAHFLISIAPLVVKYLPSYPSVAELKARILSEVKRPRSLKPKIADQVIERAASEARMLT